MSARLRTVVGVGEDRGMVTMFVAVLAASLLLVTGIVVDGGRLLNRYVEAHNVAGNAARAGAQALDEDLLYEGGGPQVIRNEAEIAVRAYMEDAGHDGTARVTEVAGERVVVEVQMTQSMMMLGGGTRTLTATASATARRGVEGAS